MNAAQQKLLNIIGAAVKTPVTQESITAEVAAAAEETQDKYIIQLVSFFRLSEELLRDSLSAAMQELDRIKVPELKEFIQGFITNYSSAVDARNNFTLKWFKSHKISPEAKCEIARFLISIAEPYLHTMMPSHWQALARNDQSYMAAVMFTLEDQ